ncbi:MAG: hypothetical protein K1X86_00430 [Ignavibacteria bacterium]|nr:hypothetical protein [Ignavibacteria bacterium]
MHTHIAIELLKTFNDEELNRFGDFVRSPFFNKREAVIKLFDLISKHSPEYTSSALKKENIYKKIFPGKKYNEQTLRSRMSELSALIKTFMIEVNFKEDIFYQKKKYTKELVKRRKFDLAERSISETDEFLKNSHQNKEISDLNFLYSKRVNVDNYISLMHAKDCNIEAMEKASEQGEFLIHNFLLEVLACNSDVICYEIETKKKFEDSYVKSFFEKFDFEGYINLLKEKNYRFYPIIAVYYYGNLAQNHPESERYFYELKNLVYKYHNQFSKTELSNYWVMLSNSAYTNFIKYGTKFKLEGHEVNKFFIDNNLYDENNPFSISGYQNIAVNALNVGDLDWGEEFLGKFKNNFLPELIDSRYHYCKAIFLFEKKKFEDAIENLSKVKFTDWNIKLEIRLNYLKNYYELSMSEQVFSLIDSFKHFDSNNPDIAPEYMDEKIKNTIRYISKISNAKFGGKQLDYAAYKEMEDTRNVLYKKWILEKMKELI